MLKELTTRPDPDAETVLKFAEVEFVVKAISIEDVDWRESANNCARLWNPLNEEKIDDYRMAMEGGDVFPMPVMEAAKTGLVILGGNQRMNAARRINPSMLLTAYVVRPLLTSQRELIIRSLNSKHGWGSEKEERLAHAVFLVHKHGISAADAAKLFVVSASSITLRIRADETKAALARKSIDASRLALTALSAIASIQDEKQATAIAKVAVENQATGDEVVAAVNKLNAAKSTAEKAKCVKAFSSSLQASVKKEGESGGIKKPRRKKFLSYLESFAEFLDHGNGGDGFTSLDELQCVANIDGEKIAMLSNKIIVRLNIIRGQ
jgi:transposase